MGKSGEPEILKRCRKVTFLFFIYKFIYFIFGCVGFGPCEKHGLLLLRSTGSRWAGFSSCGAQAQQLWRTGLVAPRHVGSSQTRARTHVPCIGRWILNHCATREAPERLLFYP